MTPLYLFTWNLKTQPAAHDLAVDHLAKRGMKDLFIGCVQELPAESLIAQGRKVSQPDLFSKKIEVVRKKARALALVYHRDLVVQRDEADEDDEFVAAIFQLPSSKKQIGVVGLHAKSTVDMQRAEDCGGSRALLRHSINQLKLQCDHTVILGDFNSASSAREVQSWHCFYALSGTSKRLTVPSSRTRRGLDHPPFYIVKPSNADGMGTFIHSDSGSVDHKIIDFIAVDEGSHPSSSSKILTEVSATPVWDAVEQRPCISDHLPVEGTLHI